MAVPSAARYRGILSDHSGTVAAGGIAQRLLPPNARRDYLLIQNLDTSVDLWVDFGQAATPAAPSIRVPAGQRLTMEKTFIPTDSVWLVSVTTGHPFAAKEG